MDQRSIEGELTTKLYITVSKQEHQEKLEQLGGFGEKLENIRKRSNDRIGITTRQLLELEVISTQRSVTFLTLPEAFYLAYALGCMTITSTDTETLDIAILWNRFREKYRKRNIINDFAIEYGVYHYFRCRGWVVKSGANYGTSFLLYRGGPTLEHAQYAVIVLDETNKSSRGSLDWQSILTFHRVVQSVCKELLLVFVSLAGGSDDNLEKPSCIAKMKVVSRIFSSQSKGTKLL